MKLRTLIIVIFLVISSLVGCSHYEEPKSETEQSSDTQQETNAG